MSVHDYWGSLRDDLARNGRMIRTRRLAADLHLDDVARAVGTDAPMLSRIEHGTACPTPNTGTRLTDWIRRQDRLQTPLSDVPGPSGRSYRTGDPDTSQAAAQAVNIRHAKSLQWWILRWLGSPLQSDDDRTHLGVHAGLRHVQPSPTESGCRTRLNELVKAGLVRDTGRRAVLPTGRKAVVWDITDAGRDALNEARYKEQTT